MTTFELRTAALELPAGLAFARCVLFAGSLQDAHMMITRNKRATLTLLA